MVEGDDSPVGILLCTDKNHNLGRFSLEYLFVPMIVTPQKQTDFGGRFAYNYFLNILLVRVT